MKTTKLLITVAIMLLFLSCEEKTKSAFWGETKYYSNFLWCKYKPVCMERTLNFDFNSDAQRLIDKDIEFEIVEKNTFGEFVQAKNIRLYKNGEECITNILSVHPSENEVSVSIVFTDEAHDGYHTFYLCEKGESGLDRIDYLELTNGFCAKKQIVWNPLAKILVWTLITIVALMLAWIILLKPLMIETFKVKKIQIIYTDAIKSIKIKGYKKVICSNHKQTQSFVSKIFLGKILFVQNEFWEQDMEIVPKNKKSVRVRLPKCFSVSPSSTVTIGADTEIINMNTNKITNLKIN